MKTFFLLAICLLFAFSSCKKKADVVVSVNTISATVDGVDVNFSAVADAHFTNLPSPTPATTLVINGATGTDGNQASIVVDVTTYSPITTGTFVSSDTNSPVAFSDIIYEKSVSTSQLAQPYITDNSGTNPTSVTITSISSTHVQGTFNGTLVYSLGNAPSKTVTNGKFDLDIKQ